jgi:hypothetical protein
MTRTSCRRDAKRRITRAIANADGASLQVARDGRPQGMLSSGKEGAVFATYQDGKITWACPPYFEDLQEP